MEEDLVKTSEKVTLISIGVAILFVLFILTMIYVFLRPFIVGNYCARIAREIEKCEKEQSFFLIV